MNTRRFSGLLSKAPLLKTFVATVLMAASVVASAADRTTIPPRKDYAFAAVALQRFIEHELQDKQLPAISVSLVDGNEIVWARGFGFADPERKIPATADTVYRIGSVSKLFTDIGIMQMVEQGQIDLDAPVQTYLPDFKPANQFSKPITLRQLMSHRSGLLREPGVGHYFDPTEPTLADTVRSVNGYPLLYEPETRVKYSNAGIAVVGYTLEYMNRQPFAKYLKQAVLKPLGLQSSAFEPEPAITDRLAKAYMWTYTGKVFEAPTFQLGMAPAGSMYSTVTDLGRFVIALLNGGRGLNGPILKADTLNKMWAPQFAQGGSRNFGIGFILGNIDGHRVVGHGGAIYGFATEVELMPEEKLGAVAVTTMDAANGVSVRIANEALRVMLAVKAGKPVPAIETTQAIPADVVHKLAGRYGEGNSALDLIERNGGLYAMRVRGGYELRLRQLGDVLVVDDRIGYGTKISVVDGGIKVGDEVLQRTAPAKSTPIPEEWKGLIGEYGWDHDVLFILEREGRLISLIEWFEYQSLEQVSKDVFLYPARGLYDNEKFVFTRDAEGTATQVQVGGAVFKRRTPKDWRRDP
jgi:CubicO group peptidase (beta-lactamase class C family)